MGTFPMLGGFLLGAAFSVAGWFIGRTLYTVEFSYVSLTFAVVGGALSGGYCAYSTRSSQARVYLGSRGDMFGFYVEFFFRAAGVSGVIAMPGMMLANPDTTMSALISCLGAGAFGTLSIWIAMKRIVGLAAVYTDQNDKLAPRYGKVGQFRFQSQSGVPKMRIFGQTVPLFPMSIPAERDDEEQTVWVESQPEVFHERLAAGLGDWSDDGLLEAFQTALNADGRFPGYTVAWKYTVATE